MPPRKAATNARVALGMDETAAQASAVSAEQRHGVTDAPPAALSELDQRAFEAEEAAAEGRAPQPIVGDSTAASSSSTSDVARGKMPVAAGSVAVAAAGSAAAPAAAGEPSTASGGGDGRRFQRELRSMMYGFGDDRQPLTRSVELMEELVVDYVYQVLHRAQGACESRLRGPRGGAAGRLKECDLIFALRKDPKRKERVEELLDVWKEVKAARSNSGQGRALDDELEYERD